MPVCSFDDDFGRGFDADKLAFHPSRPALPEPGSSIRLRPKGKRGSLFPDEAQPADPVGRAFSSRYDFSASLSAALSTAQTVLGDRSGLGARPEDKSDEAPSAAAAPGPRPDALSLEKPDLQSAEYNELIQKFCFVRTGLGLAQC